MRWFAYVISLWLVLLVCSVLLGCVSDSASAPPPIVATNSYCSAYHRVIRTEEEGASLHGAHRPVKERIAANETLYKCECEHWDNPICKR